MSEALGSIPSNRTANKQTNKKAASHFSPFYGSSLYGGRLNILTSKVGAEAYTFYFSSVTKWQYFQ
jgi:hypothetical protein